MPLKSIGIVTVKTLTTRYVEQKHGLEGTLYIYMHTWSAHSGWRKSKKKSALQIISDNYYNLLQ